MKETMTQEILSSMESGSLEIGGGSVSGTLIDISDRAFCNHEIQIDGYRFINCIFQNCRLVVRTGMFEFHACLKTGGTFLFSGRALQCVQLLKQDASVLLQQNGGDDSTSLSSSPGEENRHGNLQGRLIRFYLLLFFMAFSALAFLFITMASSDPLIHYGGPIIAGHILVALIIFALYHYFFMQKPAEEENQKSFTVRQAWEFLKEILPGYDENICPDGVVTENARGGKFRECSEDEKTAFRQTHKQVLREKYRRAALYLRLLSFAGQDPGVG